MAGNVVVTWGNLVSVVLVVSVVWYRVIVVVPYSDT